MMSFPVPRYRSGRWRLLPGLGAVLLLLAGSSGAIAVDREALEPGPRKTVSRRWAALGDPVLTFYRGLEPDRRPGIARWVRLGPGTHFGLGYGASADRVDGVGLLLSQELRSRGWGPSLSFYESYGLASSDWSGAVEARITPGNGPLVLGFRWTEENRDFPLPRPAISGIENSLGAFFAREDTRDYYRREARTYSASWAFPLLPRERENGPRRDSPRYSARSGLILAFHDERHRTLRRGTEKLGPFGGDRRLPENPAVVEGAWDLLQLRLSWSPYRLPALWSQQLVPSLLVEGLWAGGNLGDGRAFTRVWAEHRGTAALGRGQGLSYRLAAGTATQGEPEAGSRLPGQWQFQAGGVGTLRGHRFQEFRGDRLLLATVEYDIELGAQVRPVLFLDGGKAWNQNDDQSGGLGGSGPLALDGGLGFLVGADGLRIDVARNLRAERVPARVTIRLFHTL